MTAIAHGAADGGVDSSASEFELPSRSRDLAARIFSELITPYRHQIAEARDRRNTACREAERARAAADDALKRAELAAKARHDKTKSFAAAARERIVRVTAETRSSLASYGVSVPEPPILPDELPSPGTANPDVTEKQCGFELEYMEHEFVALKCRRVPWWPANGFAQIGLVIAFFIYGIGLLWFVGVLISRTKWQGDAEKTFRRFLGTREKLAFHLLTLDRKADEILSQEIQSLREKIAEPAAAAHKAAIAHGDAQFEQAVRDINASFAPIAQSLHRAVDKLASDSGSAGAEWNSPSWESWAPDTSPEFAARLGTLKACPEDLSFSPLNFSFVLPALVPFADGRSLLFSAQGTTTRDATDALLGVMVRVLASTPPGKARFTFVDPVGLGQNAADFLHLGDVNKDLISGKVWSEPQHIEQQLTVLTEHIETVIQTCLRNEFATIREYNRERHEVAQPFRFVVVNDFPVNFTESAARRLVSIVKNGPRCGVHTFIIHDTGKKLPYGFDLSDLQDAAVKIGFVDASQQFAWQDQPFDQFSLTLDKAPPKSLIDSVVKTSGEVAVPAMKIDVPFEKVLSSAGLDAHAWGKANSADGISVPLGPAGARFFQELKLGGGQEAHALLVGRTGSGKTNLMHVIITTVALKYPPSEVELYLVDFKGGVGFKRYAEYALPHAKVIAIESEREFGMSVLHGLDAELKRRSDMFRSAGVDNLAAYRARTESGTPPLPRILLVVDEFQEFFSDNDDLAQQAKAIFERLARQGRSFGIHFLLASQSLSGSAQLPPSIMGQIKVRIALPCSEADSRLILADDNKAARALSQAGEAIYNPMGGAIEGNNRFHVARFSDDDLPNYLDAVSASHRRDRTPLVFEGNELAQITECTRLAQALQASAWPESSRGLDILLGEPIAIMPPVAATLRRQSGRHLLVLTREESEGVGACTASVLSILIQQPPNKSQVFIADFATADREWAGHATEIAQSFPGQITVVNRQREVSGMLAAVAKHVQSREEYVSGQSSIYLVLQGFHRIKSLRDESEGEDGHNAVELLRTILRDGPEVGVHVVAWADTWGNATRGLDRKSVGEFGLRVASVMESGDSMNFLDSLAASKLAKPHRAIFYDEDRPGQLVTFRPYALPSRAWLQETGRRLRGRLDGRTAAHPVLT